MNKKVFVIQSSINLSTSDTETCFAVVGVADNIERAKEILKEEVESFFNSFNERFCYDEDESEWAYDHELDIDNEEDFKDDEFYHFYDYELECFAEVKILEMELNA